MANVYPYKQTRTISPVEAAYLAGLIDGEGTIALTRRHRLDNRQLMVTISSTERNLLEYAQRVLGTGHITTKRTYQANHSPGLTFAVANRQALSLLQQVTPYLKSYKVKRATLVLEHYLRLTPRNGKYTPSQKAEREAFIQRFFELRPNQKKAIIQIGQKQGLKSLKNVLEAVRS